MEVLFVVWFAWRDMQTFSQTKVTCNTFRHTWSSCYDVSRYLMGHTPPAAWAVIWNLSVNTHTHTYTENTHCSQVRGVSLLLFSHLSSASSALQQQSSSSSFTFLQKVRDGFEDKQNHTTYCFNNKQNYQHFEKHHVTFRAAASLESSLLCQKQRLNFYFSFSVLRIFCSFSSEPGSKSFIFVGRVGFVF